MSAIPPPEALVRRVAGGGEFLLVSHASPDGDAIGSLLALARILGGLGKRTWLWNRDAAPSLLQQLPGHDAIHVGESPPVGLPAGCDALVLECPTLERTALAERLAGRALLNIDHHLGNADYGVANWVDPEAPAVAVMVHDLARALAAPLDADAATLLLLGLFSDTGGFRFSNANRRAFAAAAALVDCGADPTRVSRWLYESQPPATVRLLGEMLGSLSLHHGGRIAAVRLTRAMFERSEATESDSDGLIDTPRAIAGVEATVLLKEQAANRFKVSLRSRGAVDVERIARAHGGGGHRNAAGCTVQGDLATVETEFVALLAQALQESHG